MYDITRKETFDSLQTWLAEMRQFGPEELAVVLVGNKTDCEEQRAVTAEEVDAFISMLQF